MPSPLLGAAVPWRGHAFSRAVGRLALAVIGWRIDGSFADVPQCVVIVAPHTSNWDFVVGVAGMVSLGIRIHWLGKGSLFRWPFGRILRWLGGIPVDRSAPDGVVEGAVAMFERHPSFFLGLTPEGTRKRVERWKSGFYRIAVAARVPLFLVAFDYRDRVIGLGPLFWPTGDLAADLPEVQKHFTSAMAKKPAGYAEPLAGAGPRPPAQPSSKSATIGR
jgi:1-acyl-sn-glycerol-3-phosphate acyltransferase